MSSILYSFDHVQTHAATCQIQKHIFNSLEQEGLSCCTEGFKNTFKFSADNDVSELKDTNNHCRNHISDTWCVFQKCLEK